MNTTSATNIRNPQTPFDPFMSSCTSDRMPVPASIESSSELSALKKLLLSIVPMTAADRANSKNANTYIIIIMEIINKVTVNW